uniref:Titin n=1 Tax=Leptobrachium leishanense TaxID=445787 RepID=A0A8C5R2U4_9ANUR
MSLLGPPGAPGKPEATNVTKTTVTVGWKRPAHDGGSEITGYYVERKEKKGLRWVRAAKKPVSDLRLKVTGLTEGNEYEFRVNTTGSALRITEFVVANLQPGGKYKFRIRAINAAGTGEPAQIDDIEIKDREETPDFELDAELRRTLVVRAGLSIRIFVPIKGRPAPEVTWMKGDVPLKLRANIENTESFSLLIITECNRYDAGKYTMTLENAAGKKSGFVNVKVLDSPGPPSNLKARDVTKDSITLQWDMPLIDGGSRITNYIVEKRESTRKAYSTITTNCQKCSLRIPNLAEGCEYYFRVLAENEFGIGEPVETAEPIRATEAPSPPESLNIMDITKTTVSLAWPKSEHDGGSKITGYVIEAQKRGSTQWTHIATVKALDYLVKNLNENEEYVFQVMAVNSAGRSDPRESRPVVVKEHQPSEPSDVITCRDDIEEPRIMVDAKFKDVVILKAGDTFRLDADVSGRPPPTLTWTKEGKDLEVTGKLEIKLADFSTALINKDSLRKDGGAYTLMASNPGGFAKHIFNVKVLDRPGPCEGPLSVADVTSEKCVISWLPPLDDGGAKIDHYIVEKRETSRLAWTSVATDVQVTKFKVTKLLKGNEYIFRVMAVNKYGVGEILESEPTLAVNPYVPPDPPKTPEVTTATKDTMIVCWGHPESDGGSPITNYIVERRDRSGLRWVKCNKRILTDLRYKVSGLTEGHEYEYRVMAENAAGISKPSSCSPFYKACDTAFKPGPPGNPRVLDTTKSSITIAWNKPVYDGGSEITGYLVDISLPEEDEWKVVTPPAGLKATSYTITGLKENQEYKIQIYAQNAEGVGDPALVPGTPKAEERMLPPEIELDAELRKVICIRACCTLRVFVPIKGRPAPEVKWSRENGENIERANIESTSSYTLLIIENVNRFDSGKYMLTIENSSGSKTAFVNVRVLDTPGAPQDLKIKEITKESVTLTWDPPLIDGGSKIKNYIVEKRESTRKAWEKPEHDGGSRILGYIVEMQTKGSEKWTTCTTVKTTDAKISGLIQGEEYTFRVSAQNEKGISDPRQLGVPVVAKDLVIAPAFKLLFNTFSVLAGEDLKVDVPFVARPKPTITWHKDNLSLKQTTRVNAENTENNSLLTIKEASKEDVGQYTIKLANTAGEATEQLSIVVLDKPEPPTGPVKIEEVTADKLRKIVNVRAGGSLRLFIPIRGRPAPEVKWGKVDGEIRDTAQIDVTSSFTALVLDNVNRFDSGKYTLTIENSSGTKSAFISVRVLDTPSAPVNLKIK